MRLGRLTVVADGGFLLFSDGGRAVAVEGPRFEIEGVVRETWKFQSETVINPFEGTFTFDDGPLRLIVEVEGSASVALARLTYRLEGAGAFTGTAIRYFATPFVGFLRETRLAEFEPVQHTYFPSVHLYAGHLGELPEGRRVQGPIVEVVAAHLRIAYEHGGEQPNLSFLHYEIVGDTLELRATRDNVHAGQAVDGWTSVALQVGLDVSDEEYREFIRAEICPTPESRAPRLFYNTWHHQESVKYLQGRPYLAEMNLDRMLREIDVAAEIGLETFVIDTGWYGRVGDWQVDAGRFPDLLQDVRKRLEGYGMELGLWFNPIVAAKTSAVVQAHPEWIMTRGGKKDDWGKIWETEEAYGMCLCTPWADEFVDQLERLHRETGVTYLKWDAVGMTGCDDSNHGHGGPENTPEERAGRYSFEVGRRLAYVAEAITTRVPGTVVDFDVTEDGRYVGLDFLRVGKYFLINNGPYYSNFDTPKEFRREPDTINATFFPGAARSRIARAPARYDHVIPSVLFLSHGLTHGDRRARENAFATIALGGNGLWGELPELDAEARAFWAENLARYKTVRDAATRAFPRVRGERWGAPEIHEKIHEGVGLVAFFTHGAADIEHVVPGLSEAPSSVEGADRWEWTGRALRLWVNLEKDGARLVTIR